MPIVPMVNNTMMQVTSLGEAVEVDCQAVVVHDIPLLAEVIDSIPFATQSQSTLKQKKWHQLTK